MPRSTTRPRWCSSAPATAAADRGLGTRLPRRRPPLGGGCFVVARQPPFDDSGSVAMRRPSAGQGLTRMRLLPLTLSAHVSTLWTMPDSFQEPDPLANEPCCFCGQVSGRWQERFHLNGDHTNNGSDNVVAACPLCHLVHHLERPKISEEAALIWLPEMSQRALISQVRTLHLALRAAGERVDTEVVSPGRSGTSPHLYRARQELLARATPAKGRLGTSSPRALGAALRALPAAAYARRDQLLGGLRLLPLGRLYHGDQDVYPEVLATWAQLGPATHASRS